MENKDWMKLASSKADRKELRVPFISEKWKFATDGYRIHIVKMDEVPAKEETNGANLKKVLEEIRNADVTIEAPVHPRFLIEALQGFEDDMTVVLGIIHNENGDPIICIKGVRENVDKEAYIMGMALKENDNE